MPTTHLMSPEPSQPMAANTSQLPLTGVVTCCTSIEPERRSGFAALIVEMGGVNKLDLISDVTHLIVGGYDTPKYKYVAKERPDVKAMLPEWLEAVRESWLEGGETDVGALELEYRLPTFQGLRLCVTGFTDCEEKLDPIYRQYLFANKKKVETRKSLQRLVEINGGQYRGDLTKEITHLVANTPQGAKYIHAKQWNIPVVGVEWLHQSIERGMILDEDLFDPHLPSADRGIGAWVQRSTSTTSLKKRSREESGAGARKLRRTASAKFGSQSDALWGDIVGGGFTPKEVKKDEWEDVPEHRSFKTSPSERVDTPTLPAPPRPASAGSLSKKPATKRGLFAGKRFHLHGFDAKKIAVLEKHLNSNDAELIPSIDLLSEHSDSTEPQSSFLLVPHDSSEQDIPSTPSVPSQPKVVNELWLEKCLHSKQLVEPETNAAYEPFKFPIPGFENLAISTTGFQDIELSHVGKTIRLVGASYAGTLTKDVSALVCHNDISSSREKVQYAIKWKVPVVKADWLWDSIRSGEVKSVWDYLVYPGRQERPEEPSKTGNDDAEDEGEGEGEGDKDFHNPKRSNAGPRKKELDYGKGPRMWLRRKDESTSENVEANAFKPITRSHLAQSAIEDSFSLPADAADDQLVPSPSDHADSETQDSLLLAQSVPLRERSPNSPTKPRLLPKDIDDEKKKAEAKAEQDSLSSAISSLLAARQRDAAPANIDTSGNPPRRRKRDLLGRANSNLSARSGSLLSRASSVDTLNTDGVGTPVDMGPLSAASASMDPLTEALLGEDAPNVQDQPAEPAPSTQVGYKEEAADQWREDVAKRMGWKRDKPGQKEEELGRGKRRVVNNIQPNRRTRTGGR